MRGRPGQCILHNPATTTCSKTLITYITVTVPAPDVQNSMAISFVKAWAVEGLCRVSPVRILISVCLPFTVLVVEYANMIYVFGFCDGYSVQAVAEYQQRFPNHRIPTRRVFTQVYQTLQDTGTLPGVHIAAECDVNEGVNEEEGIVQMAQSSPRASTRRTARRLRVPHTRMWRTLHAEGMYPYHMQRMQHLRPGDFAERLEFCKWLNGIRELHRYSLFTDESQFNRNGVNNTHNSHVWADENPHTTVESNFQQRFSVNV